MRKSALAEVSGSPQERAEKMFRRAEREHEKSSKRLNQGFAHLDKLDVIPEKDRPKWDAALIEFDRTLTVMFQTFDAWQYTANHTILVDEEEIKPLVLDAFMANTEAWPDAESLSGLERHRMFKNLTDDVFGFFKTGRVSVIEEEMGAPPYCDDCEEAA